ncbi:type I DNA topoisomerase [Gallibacter intestinalis]|uniref:DNA topoisomerase 1 n=1 Tax=Gallibacter intestinalis TaxID=2779356 RepID=A0ABR9QVX8_9FIRM|nr:type I DNA topoisomerase [Gallibacter intestinalis]MBE5034902.1 type I DNA topoisomerase [Gallibacter intestinalis]
MAQAKKKQTRKKNLVIVESPSKAKTIGKFLGSNYKVIASVGHVRDLPKSTMGIDIENDFEPRYINIRGKGDVIKSLKKEAKAAGKIYLATDPDREGEAISWHLAYLLGIDPEEPCRIVFNEITKTAVKNAVKNPRKIDMGLVDAQQARRVLDRVVGYSISPLLWRKVRRGLSAGRVQSAALKLICDRENEILEFNPVEYWNIFADLKGEKTFESKLTLYKGKKIENGTIGTKAESNSIIKEVKAGEFTVAKVEEKTRSRKPQAPYTTSSLQQDAANRVNFNTRKTMQIAQQLYEGVEVKGHGTIGLVSYIRTDSTRISEEARAAAKEYITEKFGADYYGGIIYVNKNKDAQDAHEAIRPSNVALDPESIKDSLTTDQYKLYSLIWSRFVASQMTNAEYFGVTADIENGQCIFRATGSKLTFDGFLKVYSMSDIDEDKMLPDLKEGQKLKAEKIRGEQSFTQPPARFTEASLVKTLEELNIGRPSTYAPIVATLTDRRYIKKEGKSLKPTDLGFTVTNLLSEYFKEIVDVGFTAEMEDKLDEVGVSISDWKQILRDFYGDFEKELKEADENIEKMDDEEITDIKCELCGKYMVKKHGRYGEFLACSGYPECKNTKPVVKEIGVDCPKCGKPIVEKRSRRGRIFYGCSGYPECDNSYWNKPVNKKCPKCGALLTEKKTKSFEGLVCSNSECGYKEKTEV